MNTENMNKEVVNMPDVIGALERARTMEQEITTQIEHIERLRRISRRAHASTDIARETVEKLAKLESQINDSIDIMCDAKADALRFISFLTGEERSVIEGYYILAKSWQQLALDLYMSERRVFMLRKSGLTKLIERYGGKLPARKSSHN